MRSIRVLFLAGVIAGIAGGEALAAGSGGGGGGMSLPSESGPRYDPAQEYAKAIAALNAGDYKAAARSAQRVTEALPQGLDGWMALGAAQTGAENWKGARRAYERALKIAPDEVDARGGLGLALARLNDPKAQDQLDWLKTRAAACGPGCDAARLRAVIAELEKALAAPTAPSARRDQPLILADAGDVAYLDAVGLINEGRYDAALARLDIARAAFGPHPDVLTYQGFVHRKLGQFEVAEGFYRQALAAAPGHRGALEYYGELKVERGDKMGARRLLARLERACIYGCAEAETLRSWIDAGGEPGR
jgi:Flp pilus assembly protein TadD